MKRFFLLTALVLSTSFIYAQGGRAVNIGSGSNGLGGNGYGTNNLLNFVKGDWVKESAKEDAFIGTNYIYTNWTNNAEIYDLNGKGYKLPNCNFNASTNRIEALLEDNKDAKEKTFAFNSRDISKVKIGNKHFVNKTTTDNPSVLLEVINEGSSLSLFKGYVTEIVLASYNPMTQKKMGKDKIDINTVYYVEKEGKTSAIKLKKSSILKLMANNKDEVKNFIKENKLSVSEDADLFKIFSYYNSL